MVLTELGGNISRALQRMSEATVVDEEVLKECLNEIARALLQADVKINMVKDLQTNIKNIVRSEKFAAGYDKRQIIKQAVFSELCRMLDAGKPSFEPKKGKTCVVLFVGLQGSGKTTTCMKYAYNHQKKGWKPALVCASTLSASDFDQLKQNAERVKIPFYGRESDPVKVAADGVEKFKQEYHDLIIVDTSCRQKQEAAYFEEMCQVSEATKPNLVVFVLDCCIGQAAFNQAQAFKQSVAVGAVIVTKIDVHAKGGGTLSALAAAKIPVIFITTGEHMDEFEVYDVKHFVARLLGDVSDWSDVNQFDVLNKLKEAMPADQRSEFYQELLTGELTLKMLYNLYQLLIDMVPIGQDMSMPPGSIVELMPKGHARKSPVMLMKCYRNIMDFMTYAELDSKDLKMMCKSRMIHIARDSGYTLQDVIDLINEYKRLRLVCSKLKALKKDNKFILSPSMNAQQMKEVLPPETVKQLGGLRSLHSIAKRAGSNKNSGS